MTEAEGAYTVAAAEYAKGTWFKVYKLVGEDEDENKTWYGAAAGMTDLSLTDPMDAVEGDNGVNWVLQQNANISFSWNAETKQLSVAGTIEEPTPVVTEWHFYYGNNDGDINDVKMTEKDGKYEVASAEYKADYWFKVYKLVGEDKDENKTWYGPEQGMNAIALDVAMTAVEGSNENWNTGLGGTFAFSWDPENLKLTVTGTAVEPEPEPQPEVAKYILRVTAPRNADWNDKVSNDVELVKNAAGKYEFNGYIINKNSNFGVVAQDAEGNQLAWYGSSLDDTTVALGEAMTAKADGKDWFIANIGKFNFTFDAEAPSMTVTEVEVAKITVYYDNKDTNWTKVMVHYWNNENGYDAYEEMTLAATPSAANAAPNTIHKAEIPQDIDGVQFKDANSDAITAAFQPVGGNVYHNSMEENASGTRYEDYTTGISNIAADADNDAVYFNLQGVRVANPEAGQLYIVKKGNKVAKVIL